MTPATVLPDAVQTVDWVALAPAGLTAAGMLILLLVQALWPTRAARGRVLDAITVTTLLASGAAVAVAAGREVVTTFCTDAGCSWEAGGWTAATQALVLCCALVCVLLAVDDPVTSGCSTGADTLRRTEFHALLVAAVTGALVLAGARDLLTILIAVETASLPVVGLVGLGRAPEAAEAAVKLLLVSVVSFGLAMLGVALVYAGQGSVYVRAMTADTGDPATMLGVAFVVAGFGYKVAALPFGLWVPDVYAGSPLPVATLLTTVSKVAGLLGIGLVLGIARPGHGGTWFTVLVAVTMTVGNLVAFTQTGAVRLLAWSTIAQAGWVLLPFAGVGGEAVLWAAVSYLVAYCAAALTAFTVVLLVGRHHCRGAGHDITDHRGLLRREPVAGAALALALLSLAGLPPGIAGLVAKVAVLTPVIEGHLWWLALVAAGNVAIALAYYLRWAWLLAQPPGPDTPTWRVTWAEGGALSVAAGFLVSITVLPGIII